MKTSIAATALLSAAAAEPLYYAERSANNASAFQAGNPFSAGKMYASNFYANEVKAAIPKLSDASMATAAKKAGDIPSFYWMYVIVKEFVFVNY